MLDNLDETQKFFWKMQVTKNHSSKSKKSE